MLGKKRFLLQQIGNNVEWGDYFVETIRSEKRSDTKMLLLSPKFVAFFAYVVTFFLQH